MKKTIKKTVKNIGKTSKAPVKRVPLSSVSKTSLKHFRFVEHKHTGKLLHHKNTSHLSLIVILFVIGIFLFFCGNIANTVAENGVNVSVIVSGPAPQIGATITSPLTETSYKDQDVIEINGTCKPESYVVINSNNIAVGSTNCTVAGIFKLHVQLQIGKNVLSALNYDNLNQVGPSTPSVNLYLTKSESKITAMTIVKTPTLATNPSIIAGVNNNAVAECDKFNPGSLPDSEVPYVSVACVPRVFLPNVLQKLGLVVWGGTPPYAISIDWNSSDIENTLLSVEKPGYKTVSFSYALPNTYNFKVNLTDKNSKAAMVQSSVQVNGNTNNGSGSTGSKSDNTFLENVVDSVWFKTPVPFYSLAVAITLGFWGGDVFDRYSENNKKRHRKRTI